METEGKYILKDGEPVPERDLIVWAKWFEDAGEERRVAEDHIGDYYISTVFLGMDHGFGKGAPILYETIVFREKWPWYFWFVVAWERYVLRRSYYHPESEMFCERCTTKKEAITMHAAACVMASKGEFEKA